MSSTITDQDGRRRLAAGAPASQGGRFAAQLSAPQTATLTTDSTPARSTAGRSQWQAARQLRAALQAHEDTAAVAWADETFSGDYAHVDLVHTPGVGRVLRLYGHDGQQHEYGGFTVRELPSTRPAGLSAERTDEIRDLKSALEALVEHRHDSVEPQKDYTGLGQTIHRLELGKGRTAEWSDLLDAATSQPDLNRAIGRRIGDAFGAVDVEVDAGDFESEARNLDPDLVDALEAHGVAVGDELATTDAYEQFEAELHERARTRLPQVAEAALEQLAARYPEVTW